MKTELMLTTRPVRHVFFVSAHDLERFCAIATNCCTRWGGINDLIIPIDTTDDLKGFSLAERNLLSLAQPHRPDCFIQTLSQEEQECSTWKQVIGAIDRLFPRKPLLTWDVFCQESQEVHPASFISPDEVVTSSFAYHPVNQGFAPVPALSHFVWSQFDPVPSDTVQAAITAAFGNVSSQDRTIYPPLRLIPIDGLEEAMLRGQMSTNPFGSIINLTSKELKRLTTVSTFPSLAFDVVIAQNVRSFCLFWNLRAFSFGYHWLPDRRVFLLTKEQFLNERYYRPLFRLIKEQRGTPSYWAEHIKLRSQEQDPQAALLLPDLDVTFHYEDDEEIKAFLQAQEELYPCPGRSFQGWLDEQGEPHREEIGTWKGAEAERPLFYFENGVERVSSCHAYGGTLTPFFAEVIEGENTLPVPSPQLNLGEVREVRKDIVSLMWQSYLSHPSVATLVAPDGTFDTIAEDVEPIFSYPGSIGGPITSIQRISFALPKTWEMYQAYFGSLGYEVAPSDKMAYATGLLNLAGGLDQATIFRSHTAFRLLDQLAMRASQKLAREIVRLIPEEVLASLSEESLREVIAASDFVPRFQRNPKSLNELKMLFPREQKAACLEVLSALVQMKAIQRGWTLLCPHCRVSQWYGLGTLDERILCQGCLESFDIPLKVTELADVDRPVQYALNPLTDRAMDQDILPVIIALLALRTQHESMAHVVPGMAFKERRSSATKGDFDFLYVCHQQLYGGECKNGQILKSKDIQTAELAQQLGFRAFFFATTSQFSLESKKLISELQQSLQNKQAIGRPFDVFMLEDQQMFSGPLPENIPVTSYRKIWPYT